MLTQKSADNRINPISALQMLCAKNGYGNPIYETTRDNGMCNVVCTIENQVSEFAVNKNAKTAKVYGAKKALERLRNQTIKLEAYLEPDEIVDTREAIAFLSQHFKQKNGKPRHLPTNPNACFEHILCLKGSPISELIHNFVKTGHCHYPLFQCTGKATVSIGNVDEPRSITINAVGTYRNKKTAEKIFYSKLLNKAYYALI